MTTFQPPILLSLLFQIPHFPQISSMQTLSTISSVEKLDPILMSLFLPTFTPSQDATQLILCLPTLETALTSPLLSCNEAGHYFSRNSSLTIPTSTIMIPYPNYFSHLIKYFFQQVLSLTTFTHPHIESQIHTSLSF